MNLLTMPVGPMGGLQRAPRGSECELGTTFPWSYSHNDIVESFIAMQVIFAEIFVPQDFTIRTAHGFKGPANTCDHRKKKCLVQKS